MTRGIFLLTILALMTFSAASSGAESHPAVPVVESLHEVMVDTMKQAEELGYQGRFDLLSPAIKGAYDLDFMAQKVVGRHWKTLSQVEQERWQNLFSSLTVSNYAGRFEGYKGESFETVGHQEAAHETIMVQTRLILPEGEPIEFNYRLRDGESGWRIIDVYMNGTVSELALRRSDFSTTLKSEGFEELEKSVEAKIAQFADDADDTLVAKP